jgi:alpha-L-arabinofuranosidase
VATPNYFVQQIFSNNKGTHTVSITNNGEIAAGKDSIYASATIDKKTKKLFIKIVNNASVAQPIEIKLDAPAKSKGILQILTARDLMDYNTLDNPKAVYPRTNDLKVSGKGVKTKVLPKSANLVTLQL